MRANLLLMLLAVASFILVHGVNNISSSRPFAAAADVAAISGLLFGALLVLARTIMARRKAVTHG